MYVYNWYYGRQLFASGVINFTCRRGFIDIIARLFAQTFDTMTFYFSIFFLLQHPFVPVSGVYTITPRASWKCFRKSTWRQFTRACVRLYIFYIYTLAFVRCSEDEQSPCSLICRVRFEKKVLSVLLRKYDSFFEP